MTAGRGPAAPELLARSQRRLWRLIASPEGVRAALAEEREAEPLSSLVRDDARLCAEERLDVYANAYFYRILEVLQQDFPTLAESLGETGFHDLATSYLAVHPSEQPSLRWIGSRMAGFLADSPAAEPFRRRAPWAACLAALEWAMGEAFDAADAETATRESLAGRAPEDWDRLPLRLAPSVRLLRLEWPVQELCAAKRDGRPLPTIEPAETALCVWRRDEQVFHRPLEPLEADALGGTVTFGALCLQLAREVGEADAPALAAGWLGRWTDDGLLLRFAESDRSR